MPITIQRLEERIYHANYEGELTLKEITSGNLEALARKHDETPYIAIIDATKLQKVPFDVRGIRTMDTSYSAQTVFVINPPIMFAILIDILRRVISKRIVTVESLEEALEKAKEARDLIAA